MQAWQLTESELAVILDRVNETYGGNIRLENVRTEGVRVRTVCFILRTKDSRGDGSRRAMRYDGSLARPERTRLRTQFRRRASRARDRR